MTAGAGQTLCILAFVKFVEYVAKHQKKYKAPVLFDLITTGMYEWWMTVMKKEYVQSCKKTLHESKQ